MRTLRNMRGFTLIELLIVMGILGILLAIVLIALNPQAQFKEANDTQRRSDVVAILDAVHQYVIDHKGALPTGIDTTVRSVASGAGNADLCSSVVPTYIADLPQDPTTGTRTPSGLCTSATSYNTGYTIVSSASNNRVTVAAPAAEGGTAISVTR